MSVVPGVGISAGMELLTELAKLGASPAIQELAKQWLVKRAGLPQEKLDALIAAEHPEPPPKE